MTLVFAIGAFFLGSGLLYQFVGLKIHVKNKTPSPCPASHGWALDNRFRRWYTRNIFKRIGLLPGLTALEIGPGVGTFTERAAKILGPHGRLIAVDIQPEMIARLDRRIRQSGAANVETHVADACQLPLPDNSVDRIFLITVLPEIPDQQRALKEMGRVLRSGGVLSISEDFWDPDYPGRSTVIRLVTEAGYDLVEKHGNWYFYTLNFKKPE
jgi:ubiquinone/menaquinone biosynthesis C-methylase UbiE